MTITISVVEQESVQTLFPKAPKRRENFTITTISMDSSAQLLLVFLAAKAYGLHHHTTAAGYPGPGFGGYAAPVAANAYRGYADYASPPQPYSFGYDNVDEYGNRQFRSEQGDSSNAKTGSYGYRDAYGLYRRVNYVADANGFRATVDTNEPGTAPGASADVVFNAAPVVPPVPEVQQPQGPDLLLLLTGPGVWPAATTMHTTATVDTDMGRTVALQLATAAFRTQGIGYAPGGGSLGGYGYGAYSPYGARGAGYPAGPYGPAAYGGPNGWAAGPPGFRRR
ncbi:hypothetical protein V5799_031662 [Amblyomma americanum]|uniref:Cuticle protein n=1 Tax=Amblyomma americanum TaxID=6943 RepID=A0AAQ4DTD8_AMBAM